MSGFRDSAGRITASRQTIVSAAALAGAEAAVTHGSQLGKAVVAAVVDSSGDLLALLRADGACPACVGIARDKAYTAAAFGTSTASLGETLSVNPLLSQGIALRPGVVLFAGGLPIVIDGAVTGAIGVSGGSEEDDLACAGAGLAALGFKRASEQES